MFGKTGCLITADASEDGNIQPEGLSGYPIALDPDTSAAIAPITPETQEEEVDDAVYDEFEGDEEGHEAEIVVDDAVAEDGWIFDLYA